MKIFDIKRAIANFQRERLIGEITVYLPEPPKDYKKIAGYDLKQKDQKFTYTKQSNTEEFYRQEFSRFKNGYWFFNNGNLEWITGCHYFFLNYWRDKSKTMRFIDAQRDAFLWWWQIEKMDNMAGGNLVTCRRHGKTAIATCIGYFRTTTNRDHRCGIQSKTNKDGKVVFSKLIRSWRKLPDWLRPTHSGESRPATILEFFEPRTRTIKGEKPDFGETLDSSIDFQSSEEDAYDGEELNTVIEDETGKAVNVNTDTRWGVLSLCLMDGAAIVGKAIRTSTVEDMEKRGGKNLWTTWLASQIKTLSEETGRTDSMLTNLFIPADYGFKGVHPKSGKPFIDEYGYSNRELAKEYIMATWANLSGPRLKAAQRKNPLNIKHAFQLATGSGEFDNDLLEMQRDWLENSAPKNLLRPIEFYRDIDGIVKWRNSFNGHCEIVWDFADPSMSNQRKMGQNGFWEPANTAEFCIGIDPVAATITTGDWQSEPVAYVYRKGVSDDPDWSGMVIARFAFRTNYKRQFHQYVMMMCQYYGCKANYESDIDDYYEWFIAEGFKNYVMWRPKSTIDPLRKNVTVKYGTPSKDPYAFQKHTQTIHEYILARYNKIYFLVLVEQLLKYDIEDRNKFDDVIAFGMSLLGGLDAPSKNEEGTKPKKFMELHVPKINGRPIGNKRSRGETFVKHWLK